MYCSEVAKLLCIRKSCIVKNSNFPFVNISRTNNVLPNTAPIAKNDKSLEGGLLRNLRLAVTPSYGSGIDTYAETTKSKKSCLAGDPRHLNCCQNIRAEILDKWNKRPQPDIQKEWLKRIVFH